MQIFFSFQGDFHITAYVFDHTGYHEIPVETGVTYFRPDIADSECDLSTGSYCIDQKLLTLMVGWKSTQTILTLQSVQFALSENKMINFVQTQKNIWFSFFSSNFYFHRENWNLCSGGWYVRTFWTETVFAGGVGDRVSFSIISNVSISAMDENSFIIGTDVLQFTFFIVGFSITGLITVIG